MGRFGNPVRVKRRSIRCDAPKLSAVLGLRQIAEFARLVERVDLAEHWDAVATRLGRAINAHLWDETRGAYADCIRADGTLSPVVSQQTQTAALIAGVCAPPFGSVAREVRCSEIVERAPPDFVSGAVRFSCFFARSAGKTGTNWRFGVNHPRLLGAANRGGRDDVLGDVSSRQTAPDAFALPRLERRADVFPDTAHFGRCAARSGL